MNHRSLRLSLAEVLSFSSLTRTLIQKTASPLSSFLLIPLLSVQWCFFCLSQCRVHSWCMMLRHGAPVWSTRWTAPTDARRSGVAGRSGALGRSWMTAAVARSVQPAEGSTATAQCRGCTEWSADRDYSASFTRMKTTMETNMEFAKVFSH